MGYKKRLMKFETLFALIISKYVFGHCENLAKVLQKEVFNASGAKKASDLLIATLRSFRCEIEFNKLWQEAVSKADNLELDAPKEPRQRKLPRRFEQSSNPSPSIFLNAKDNFRKEYFAVLDLLITELERRFCQEGKKKLINLEDLIIKSATGHKYNKDEIVNILGVHASDFDLDRLMSQLCILPSIIKGKYTEVIEINITFIMDELRKETLTVRELLDQIVLIIILLQTVPASAASGERSFSALRRIKTYLRSTMKQDRLNHLLILHTHKKQAKKNRYESNH